MATLGSDDYAEEGPKKMGMQRTKCTYDALDRISDVPMPKGTEYLGDKPHLSRLRNSKSGSKGRLRPVPWETSTRSLISASLEHQDHLSDGIPNSLDNTLEELNGDGRRYGEFHSDSLKPYDHDYTIGDKDPRDNSFSGNLTKFGSDEVHRPIGGPSFPNKHKSSLKNRDLVPVITINEETSEMLAQDTIIQQLLKNRPSMTDVEEEFEKERRRRMYNMLRHSSHYKRIQIELANSTWQQADADNGGLLNSNDLDEAIAAPVITTFQQSRRRRVSFSSEHVIMHEQSVGRPPSQKQKKSIKSRIWKGLKKLFKRMKINN